MTVEKNKHADVFINGLISDEEQDKYITRDVIYKKLTIVKSEETDTTETIEDLSESKESLPAQMEPQMEGDTGRIVDMCACDENVLFLMETVTLLLWIVMGMTLIQDGDSDCGGKMIKNIVKKSNSKRYIVVGFILLGISGAIVFHSKCSKKQSINTPNNVREKVMLLCLPLRNRGSVDI